MTGHHVGNDVSTPTRDRSARFSVDISTFSVSSKFRLFALPGERTSHTRPTEFDGARRDLVHTLDNRLGPTRARVNAIESDPQIRFQQDNYEISTTRCLSR